MRIARKTTAPKPQPLLHCRDCAHSYDWNCVAVDGHLILCRCKYDAATKYGKWCKFLKDPQCGHFKKREGVQE